MTNPFAGKNLLIAIKHQKDKVIASIFQSALLVSTSGVFSKHFYGMPFYMIREKSRNIFLLRFINYLKPVNK